MLFLGQKWRFVFARFKISGCVENKQPGCRAHKSFAAGFPGNAKELPTSSPKKRNVFLYCEKYGTTLTNTTQTNSYNNFDKYTKADFQGMPKSSQPVHHRKEFFSVRNTCKNYDKYI